MRTLTFAVLLSVGCGSTTEPTKVQSETGGGEGGDGADGAVGGDQPEPASCGGAATKGEAEPPNPVAGFDASADQEPYAVVYVRYPITDVSNLDATTAQFVKIPQGEDAYPISPGASLVMRQPDGTDVVLVDCDGKDCSVMDPSVSFDGNWIYYSHIQTYPDRASESFLYKIQVAGSGTLFVPARLTYNDGFESRQYAGNTSANDDLASQAGVRDMSPIQLPDGRLAFTSNRAGLIAFHPETFLDSSHPAVHSALQQIYVMDDHLGELDTAELANMQRIDFGNLHLVQHPMVLKDGRLMFSSWHDAATKERYSMTTLFAMNPDGTGFAQITEPHDHHTEVDHFATQLPDDQIVTGFYYPSFDYGFGVLARFPIAPEGPAFTFDPVTQCYPYDGYPVSYRHFERKGWTILTTHTFPDDSPAPNSSGKYSMPSVAPGGKLLTAYSKGDVNYFDSHGGAAPLESGIYRVDEPTKDPTGDACEQQPSGAAVEDPSQLGEVVDDPAWNEIWPRAVASYARIYGVDRPRRLPDVPGTAPEDSRLHPDMPVALLGTSSMLNRESRNQSEPYDPFFADVQRETSDGNWGVYGAEAGVFADDDIHAVRIVMVVPRPYTELISAEDPNTVSDFEAIRRYIKSEQTVSVTERYSSMHGERWEVLGEFPMRKPGQTDPTGKVDTSWLARVPADTPLLVQSLDRRGMTVVSELTWRALRPGEKRGDCGGCHAHSIPAVPLAETAAGRNEPIVADGIDAADPMIADGVWDLVRHRPMLAPSGDGVTVSDAQSAPLDVEFYRDVGPILEQRCATCHTKDASPGGLFLDGTGDEDAFAQLTANPEAVYVHPQMSRYIRTPQARQSLLVWVAYGERLDGRADSDREDDLDYPSGHPAIDGLTDLERLTIARWVDLGSAVDFPGATKMRYTDDNLLPVIHISTPRRGENAADCGRLRFGVLDVESGVKDGSVRASWYLVSDAAHELLLHDIALGAADSSGAWDVALDGVPRDEWLVIRVAAEDNAGNSQISTRRVRIQN